MADTASRITILLTRNEPEGPEQALAEACAARGLDVLRVPDLYHVAETDALWDELRALPGLVVAFTRLHPRAAEWLLRKHGVGAGGLYALNLACYADAAAALAALEALGLAGGQAGPGAVLELSAETSDRWYPVADASRCTNCQHCLQFCLFGVYELDAGGQVTVAQPDNCKAGCPACSRICPASAIVFPLYTQDPAICGAPGAFVKQDAASARMFRERVGAVEAETPAVFAEIDALIDELDDMANRSL